MISKSVHLYDNLIENEDINHLLNGKPSEIVELFRLISQVLDEKNLAVITWLWNRLATSSPVNDSYKDPQTYKLLTLVQRISLEFFYLDNEAEKNDFKKHFKQVQDDLDKLDNKQKKIFEKVIRDFLSIINIGNETQIERENLKSEDNKYHVHTFNKNAYIDWHRNYFTNGLKNVACLLLKLETKDFSLPNGLKNEQTKGIILYALKNFNLSNRPISDSLEQIDHLFGINNVNISLKEIKNLNRNHVLPEYLNYLNKNGILDIGMEDIFKIDIKNKKIYKFRDQLEEKEASNFNFEDIKFIFSGISYCSSGYIFDEDTQTAYVCHADSSSNTISKFFNLIKETAEHKTKEIYFENVSPFSNDENDPLKNVTNLLIGPISQEYKRIDILISKEGTEIYESSAYGLPEDMPNVDLPNTTIDFKHQPKATINNTLSKKLSFFNLKPVIPHNMDSQSAPICLPKFEY